MKRLVPVLFAAVLSACLPAGAARPDARTANPYAGRVEVSAVHPELAKQDYLATGNDDHILGDVFKISASTNSHYALVLKSGATHLEQLNAYFYLDAGGKPGAVCGYLDAHNDGSGGETGTICPGQTASWAIVVLLTGAHATFTLSY